MVLPRLLAVTFAVSFSLAGCGSDGGPISPGAGGAGGTGGSATGGAPADAGGGAGGAGPGGSGGSAGKDAGSATGPEAGAPDAPGAALDAPGADTRPAGDGGAGSDGRPAILSEGADYPGRPEVRICDKAWSHEQCCDFLCRCLNDICSDVPRAQKNIPACGTFCPKLSNMAMRCHVYHCFESVSMGGRKDHDSHCAHAADVLPGGMCRADVYN